MRLHNTQNADGQGRTVSGIVRPMNASKLPVWRWFIVTFLAGLLLAAAARLPRRIHPDPLTVAVGMWPGCETLMLARERGLLPGEHVQIIEMTWPSATMRAFGSGVVDAAVLSLDEVMRLREDGSDLRVVMVMDASEGGDALIVGEGLRTLADLKGHRVGVDLRAAGLYLLTCALEKAGLKSADLELVPMNLPETEEFFTSKDVDAVVTSEPWLTRLKAVGARSIFDSSQTDIPVYRVMVVSEEALHDQREDVVRVVQAHFAMMKELRKHAMVEGMEAVLRRQALTKEQFFASWDRLKTFTVKDNFSLMGEHAEGLIKDAAGVETRMRASNLLFRPLGKTAWIDGSLLKEAGQ
ncbi:MAG: bacterial extracellular solute-binding s, 3 family protein [Verrucomicrobiaceae bacterium]|nr:bacterial extracellular solute-binding s, 3 family protein [Verrucomicrobiaceae bacterium]